MNRKEIVKAIGEHFKVKPKYLGVPSFAYEVETEEETFTIDREGRIKTKAGKEVTLEEIINSNAESLDLEISFLLEELTGISLKNLVFMIYSKQSLIKKSLQQEENIIELEFVSALSEEVIKTVEDFKTAIETLNPKTHKGINFDEGKLTFKLSNIDPDKIKIYSEFFSKLVIKSKELKYASAKVVDTDNDKYTFRAWLMRLGMVGNEYKDTRKVLLENLSGNTAFRKAGEEDEA